MSFHEVIRELADTDPGCLGFENLDVVAELEQLTHRLNIGISDDESGPLVVRTGDLMDAGAEDASRQVKPIRAEPDDDADAAFHLGAFLQRSPQGAEVLGGAQDSRLIE